jgi:hypothetical protein
MRVHGHNSDWCPLRGPYSHRHFPKITQPHKSASTLPLSRELGSTKVKQSRDGVLGGGAPRNQA